MIKKQLLSFKNVITATGIFWSATMFANVLNWLYNVQLGRTLSKEEFGILTVFLSFQYLISIPAFAISTTIARFIAFYTEKQEEEKHFYFFRQYWWLSCGIGVSLFILFLLSKQVLESFFGIQASFLPYIFAGMILPIFLLSFEKGNLLGKLSFGWLAILAIIEPIVKLGLVLLGKDLPISPLTLAVLALPCSVFAAWFISLLISRSSQPMSIQKPVGRQKDIKDTYSFLGNALFAGIGGVLLYNIDVLLAKHYLSPSDAGVYATLSLLGKMLYFGAGSLIPLLIPLTAQAEARNISTQKAFSLLLGLVATAGIGILGAFTLFPQYTVTFLLTQKGLVALPYLLPYSVGMLFFVLASCYSSYHLAKKNYFSAQLMIVAAGIEIILLTFFHSSINQIVTVVASTLAGLFVAIVISDLLHLTTKSIRENFYSFINIFQRDTSPLISNKKRVLILNWRDTKHVYAGGAELYLHEVAKGLTKKGYQVTQFTANDTKCDREEVVDGVSIIRRGGFITVYLWAALYLLTKFRNSFDIIIDSENGIPFFSPLFTKTPIALLIYHVHQDVFLKHLVPPFSWIANFLESHVMPFVYRYTTTIALSPSTASGIIEQLNMRVDAIIPTGIDTTYFVPGEKALHPTLSYVGRLKAYKGVQHLLNAFVFIHKKYPTARLIIAGDGDYKKHLEGLAEKLQLKKSVTFLGKVTEDKKREILQKSWVMVHPSYMEGWGITCLEANACGTPVIATNAPGLKDAVKVGVSGSLFPHGDATALTQEIFSFFANKSLLKKMNKSSREYSLRFSWEMETQKYEKLFNKIFNAINTRIATQKKTANKVIFRIGGGLYEKA